MILGVSGWLGDKMGFTEQQVRIAFVIAIFAFGVGIGVYLVLWLVKVISNE
ncbi:PspC domain-containing protein [Roseivirga sp.]|uniref:PspC domain-containing protein n=1 Tax=Roseivirga sp. TaxID=1964215 RepID=UPI003B8BCF5F